MLLKGKNSAKLLEAKNLTKVFNLGQHGELVVLKNLDFSMEKGKTGAIIGTSGVGKSTLLYILGGLDKPSSGQVLIEGQDVFAQADKQLAVWRNQNIGFVFQAHHLLAEFSALENVAMPLLLRKYSLAQAKEQATLFLTKVGLEKRLEHRPGELSGGEQQRVALARAIVTEPKILLADEPTGNLDAKTGREMNKLLISLSKEQGLTVLVVTHNLELANLLDQKWSLIEGQIELA